MWIVGKWHCVKQTWSSSVEICGAADPYAKFVWLFWLYVGKVCVGCVCGRFWFMTAGRLSSSNGL